MSPHAAQRRTPAEDTPVHIRDTSGTGQKGHPNQPAEMEGPLPRNNRGREDPTHTPKAPREMSPHATQWRNPAGDTPGHTRDTSSTGQKGHPDQPVGMEGPPPESSVCQPLHRQRQINSGRDEIRRGTGGHGTRLLLTAGSILLLILGSSVLGAGATPTPPPAAPQLEIQPFQGGHLYTTDAADE